MGGGDRISAALTHTATEIDAASLLAVCLHQQGVRVMFGVIGIPIVEVGIAAQQSGLTFLSCRNEQTASYGASVVSFLTGTPAACLSVAGPGVIHSLAGVGNAWANRWSMILISAAVVTGQRGLGAFQEAPQLDSVRPYVKWAHQLTHLELIPAAVEHAVRESTHGRPGPVYLELPTEMVLAVISKKDVQWRSKCPPPPACIAPPSAVQSALSLLLRASSPLLVLGKGAAYARAEQPLATLLSLAAIPFLPTPMGKGLLPDSHSLCVSAARSHALQHADVVLVVGARLNWMLHFGGGGRWKQGVKLIQVEISAEEIGNGADVEVALCGDAKAVVQQLVDAARQQQAVFPACQPWKDALQAIVHRNNAATAALSRVASSPVTYYRALSVLQSLMPADTVVVSEGANTMDISRTVLLHALPRCRLDAGTFATMGLGVGYAMAAAVTESSACGGQGRRVVAVQGDSAFGFSAMDVETAVRYGLRITFVVFNNSGVYSGASDDERQRGEREGGFALPVTALSYHTRYEMMGEMWGGKGKGFRVERNDELEPVLAAALQWDGVAVVNLIIQSQQERKQATHSWMSVGKAKL